MKILFFSHYFPPEVNAPATRTYEHCRRWVAQGHDVTVVTCIPNCPDGVAYQGYRNRFRPQEHEVDGIRVIRVWSFLAPNARQNRRILNYASYFFAALLAALFLKRPDVVVATSPQFFCGWVGVWAARLKRVPLVLEIRDIWPESIAAVGAMRDGRRVKIMKWLERRMYQAARHIVAVGTGYRDNILRKVPELSNNVSVITNGVDRLQFSPRPRSLEIIEQYELQEKYVCSYVGTVGMAHGLEVVIRAACRLRDQGRDDIKFMIVGDGARREELQALAHEQGVADRIVFTGRLPKEKMPEVLATSDCCLIHLRGTELFGTVIPSKIFETMAMERPIIMGVRGQACDIVCEAGAGRPMTPESDEELAQIVCEMADNPEQTARRGEHARQYVLDHYDRDELAAGYLRLLHHICGLKEPRHEESELPRRVAETLRTTDDSGVRHAI